MVGKFSDWIALVEASYNLEGNDSQWLKGLLGHVSKILNRGSEPVGWTFHCTPTTFKLGSFSEGTSKTLTYAARMSHALSTEKSLDLTYRTGVVIATASELVFPRLPDMHKMFFNLLKGRMEDLLVINCQSGMGSGVSIGMLLKQTSQVTVHERRRWPQAAAHIGAAVRLRGKIAQLSSIDSPEVEAILDSGGTLHHARSPAKDQDVRENLRAIVRRIERTRTHAGRADPDEALSNWEGLVNGRWSIVDRFDTDGRRFIVAIKNDPAHPDLRGLTPRERQVAEYVGLGCASKEIAYILGLSESSITNCTARVQSKLGIHSRAELVDFFAPNGFRRKLVEVILNGENLLITTNQLIKSYQLTELSESEREIATYLIAGSTNADIAQRRNSSEYTIANQVQSIFRKLSVRSRGELVAKLQNKKN
ncbi:Regulatory protein, luxR family [Nitrosomonas nitrosa]|jgi:DNA-binding NarL/FixJ family response regulator|uniref:Regulatory protein, luxR family n=1 Tax=Nitrosomonas nitrosa TaxID=52442 RepID=A0A8H8Z2B4_9PROT|nr:LuxR family transcriptional regulator [Nitrosomonas nitrosa]CAE6507054.1 Regulatory protein, luxR family [Nitrosomonas nitrosa]